MRPPAKRREGKGREGKGREGKGPTRSLPPCPNLNLQPATYLIFIGKSREKSKNLKNLADIVVGRQGMSDRSRSA
jgi:hypothetical protein